MIKRFSFLFLLLFAATVVMAAPHPAPQGSKINWRSYSAALKEADQKQKLLLVSLYGRWCPACKMMTQTTWSNDSVATAVERVVVPVELDVEATTPLLFCGDQKLPPGACASSYWQIGGLPAMVLLDSHGEYLHHEMGYFDPTMMHSFLSLIERETPTILREVQAYRDSLEQLQR